MANIDESIDEVKTIKNSVQDDERAKIQLYLEQMAAQKEGVKGTMYEQDSIENLKKIVRQEFENTKQTEIN